MDLRQLRYFVRMAELGSLSRAAESLHVAQPALSQQLAKLEADLGQTLLHRSPRGVSLTEAGAELLRHAVALLRQAEDARAAVAAVGEQPSGRVAVGFPQSLTPQFALPLLRAAAERHPRITLQLFDELSGVLAERVLQGHLHTALVFDEDQLLGLQQQPVLEEALFLATAPDAALSGPVPCAQLASLKLVIPTAPHGVRLRVDAALARQGLHLGPQTVEVNSIAVMKQAAAAGLGMAVLGWASMAAEVQAGALRALPIIEPALRRTAVVVQPASAPRTRAADAVTALLVATVRSLAQNAAWPGVKVLHDDEPAPR